MMPDDAGPCEEPTQEDREWWAEQTRDDDGPDDQELDRLAEEAAAANAHERGFAFY